MDFSELPPLWDEPAPMGHNGGPPLEEPRGRGRPTVMTPEIRNRILDLLFDGVPLRVICRTPGMPGRRAVYNLRASDERFDRAFRWAQYEGYLGLTHDVVQEVERMLDAGHPVKIVRMIFNWRCQQLARMNPSFFGGKDMKF
ncbi:terminase small subunit-like protein [Acidisoma silvae]|uniref:Uncharacterized protein n=1 Tax=Acidisoma silvae TaxID=2802396 RepID=A0A963YXW2_9PROT|nr:hypothetical protein [Acidisoma silvae]MCB8878270.1 hypothetical protein [Acidisoma silvae]